MNKNVFKNYFSIVISSVRERSSEAYITPAIAGWISHCVRNDFSFSTDWYKQSIKIIKNIFFYITLFALIAHPVMAQEIIPSPLTATSAAELISPIPAIDIPAPHPITATPTLIPTLENLNSLPLQQSLSATIKLPSRLLPLTRKNYNSNEKVEARLLNSDGKNLQFSLKYNNIPLKIPINKSRSSDNNDLLLTINPPRVFSPGLYQLEITNLNDFYQKQNFYWGVLGLNTDQSIYSPQDETRIGISVSDEKGIPVCDAHLTLKIEFPNTISDQPESMELSTADRSITVNPACQKHHHDQNPDYLATVKLDRTGIYNLLLQAKTKNGEYSSSDTIEVRENLPFIVTRKSPQRIYSPEKYPVNLKVTSNRDFTGQIIETVPQELTIIPPETGQKYDSVKLLALDENEASESSTISLNNPFANNYRETLAFGQNVTDPFLKRQYLAFGNIGHDGTDFALPDGTPVIASADGIVLYTAFGPYGNTIILKHSFGQTYYGHLSKFLVIPNQYVSKGEVIGLSGHTGLSTGPHLHFSLRLNNFVFENGYFGKIDPLLYLNSNTIYSENSVKQIIWNVNLKKGQTIDLGYLFNAPDISSRAYLTGPLKFLSSNINEGLDFSVNSNSETAVITSDAPENVFQESRFWQFITDTLTIKMVDYQKGSIEDLNEESITVVSTDGKVIASPNQLYLAAVAVNPDISVDSVQGMNLTWRKIASECANNTVSTALFWALGAPQVDDFVTAYFNNGIAFKGAGAIGVYRYNGVDPYEPVGRSLCLNSEHKSDSFSVSNFSLSQENSHLFVAVGHNSQSFTPGDLFTLKNQIKSGNSSGSAWLAVQNQTLAAPPADLKIDGRFADVTDWSLVIAEIIADQNKPRNIMRHGQWINSEGIKQPLTF